MLFGLLAVIGTAASLLSTGYSISMSMQNAKREKKLAEMRSNERRAQLRKTLAAQRVAMISQGSDPWTGNAVTLREQAIQDAKYEGRLDEFQTDARVQNYQTQAISSGLEGISGASGNLLKLYDTKTQGTA